MMRNGTESGRPGRTRPERQLDAALAGVPNSSKPDGVTARIAHWLLLVALLVPTFTLGANRIFLCRTADGAVLYTDVHCPDGELIAMPRDLPAAPAVGLTKTEKAALASLGDRRTRRVPRGGNASAVLARKQACDRARRELQTLQAERRRGYRLRDSARLDNRESVLRAERRASC